MNAFEELHKKGYIPPPRSGPYKKPAATDPGGKHAPPPARGATPAKTRKATPAKTARPNLHAPPSDGKPAEQKDYDPQGWAHSIAISMGFTDMPPEVEQEFAKLFTDPSDPEHLKALAYLRGTDWHHQKYSGFAAGVQNGLFGSEADYNAWHSQILDSYRQYYGRAPTAAELATFASQGFNAGVVHQIGEGHAWAQANTGDVQYALGAFDAGRVDPNSLEVLGQQYAGRSSDLGTKLQGRFELAMKKMQRIFEGTLASPNLSLGSGGLSAPSLNPKNPQDIAR